MGREATCVYKRLSSLLASKWDQPYTSTVNWVCCCLSYALLWSSIRCLRGAHFTCGRAACSPTAAPVDVVYAEAHCADQCNSDPLITIFLFFFCDLKIDNLILYKIILSMRKCLKIYICIYIYIWAARGTLCDHGNTSTGNLSITHNDTWLTCHLSYHMPKGSPPLDWLSGIPRNWCSVNPTAADMR